MGVVHARVVDDFQEVRKVQISENGNAIWIHIFSKFQQKPNDALKTTQKPSTVDLQPNQKM
jgi:hypothetical protein